MLPNLARFLQHVNIFFAQLRVRDSSELCCVNKLRQTQSTGHPRRPAADDDNIGRHLRTFDTFDRFTENQHLALNLVFHSTE